MLYELRGGKVEFKDALSDNPTFKDATLRYRCLDEMFVICERDSDIFEYQELSLRTIKSRLNAYIKRKWPKRAKTAKKARP